MSICVFLNSTILLDVHTYTSPPNTTTDNIPIQFKPAPLSMMSRRAFGYNRPKNIKEMETWVRLKAVELAERARANYEMYDLSPSKLSVELGLKPKLKSRTSSKSKRSGLVSKLDFEDSRDAGNVESLFTTAMHLMKQFKWGSQLAAHMSMTLIDFTPYEDPTNQTTMDSFYPKGVNKKSPVDGLNTTPTKGLNSVNKGRLNSTPLSSNKGLITTTQDKNIPPYKELLLQAQLKSKQAMEFHFNKVAKQDLGYQPSKQTSSTMGSEKFMASFASNSRLSFSKCSFIGSPHHIYTYLHINIYMYI